MKTKSENRNYENYTIMASFLISFVLPLSTLFANEDVMWNYKEKVRREEKKEIFLVGKEFVLRSIEVYQFVLSEQQPDVCNFTPSCSHYAYQAMKKQGPVKGSLMTIDRLQRCNPWAWNYVNKYYKVKYAKRRGYKLYDPP